MRVRAKYMLRVAGQCINPGVVFDVPEPAAREMIAHGIASPESPDKNAKVKSKK